MNHKVLVWLNGKGVADLGGGLSFDTSTLRSDGFVTVVPEPAAALLGGLGFLALLRRRRD